MLPQFFSFDVLNANNSEAIGDGRNSHKLEKS